MEDNLRPWLYGVCGGLSKQCILVGICCHLSTPQCSWYVQLFFHINPWPNFNFLLSSLQCMSADLLWYTFFWYFLDQLSSLEMQDFVSWIYTPIFLEPACECLVCQVGIHTSGSLSYHSLYVPTPLTFNCPQMLKKESAGGCFICASLWTENGSLVDHVFLDKIHVVWA